MTISEIMLPEFDHEMPETHKFLERVPEDQYGWKPHEKSMTLGRHHHQPGPTGPETRSGRGKGSARRCRR